MKNQKGFTLIEMLAVLGIIVTVAAVTSGIIFNSLRAATKTNQIDVIRQNGNFALLQISRTVQYAKSFNGVSTNGTDYSTKCWPDLVNAPSPTPTPVPIQYSSITVTGFDDSQVTFACDSSIGSPSITSSQSGTTTDLIDTNAVTISSCYFTCSQVYKTDSPSIGISFTLGQKGQSNFLEKQTSIPFSTSVTMRNSNK